MSERETPFAQHARRVLKQGEPREAGLILESWLRLNPDDAAAWEVSREAHLELGELSEAVHAAREVARLRPESAAAWWCDLGVVLGKQGETDEARKALYKALSIDPELEQARAELERTGPPQAPTAPPPSRKRRSTHPPPAPPVEQPSASPSGPQGRVAESPPPTEATWYGEPLGEAKEDGWKVRSPDGTVYGPYTDSQLAEYLAQGKIGRDWGARYGSGRVTTVREALGPARCDELLRQRVVQPTQVVAQQAEGAQVSTIRCPHCGQWTATAERRSASNARVAVIFLGLIIWPLWLLLLVLKDKMYYRCATCGMQWTSDA